MNFIPAYLKKLTYDQRNELRVAKCLYSDSDYHICLLKLALQQVAR